jgi:hypothetical protein
MGGYGDSPFSARYSKEVPTMEEELKTITGLDFTEGEVAKLKKGEHLV